jgi:hypothetical protein
VKEALFAVFLGFFAIVSLTNPHSLDGEKLGRKGGIIELLWGFPLGLICGALAFYSLLKIYGQATASSLGLSNKLEP